MCCKEQNTWLFQDTSPMVKMAQPSYGNYLQMTMFVPAAELGASVHPVGGQQWQHLRWIVPFSVVGELLLAAHNCLQCMGRAQNSQETFWDQQYSQWAIGIVPRHSSSKSCLSSRKRSNILAKSHTRALGSPRQFPVQLQEGHSAVSDCSPVTDCAGMAHTSRSAFIYCKL